MRVKCTVVNVVLFVALTELYLPVIVCHEVVSVSVAKTKKCQRSSCQLLSL